MAKSVKVPCFIEPELDVHLDALAHMEDSSKSAIVRSLIIDAVVAHGLMSTVDVIAMLKGRNVGANLA